jgi:hypothetical protein
MAGAEGLMLDRREDLEGQADAAQMVWTGVPVRLFLCEVVLI